MLSRKIILFFVSVIVVILLYNVPFYQYWLYKRVLVPDKNGDVFSQMHRLDIEERREFRFGPSYAFYRDIAIQFNENHVTHVTILLPPNDYVHAQDFAELIIPEPAEFYYFTGINAVTQASPNVREANWALVAGHGRVWMNRLRSMAQLDSLLVLYKPFKN